MKITRGELKALIREERKRLLEEGVFSAMQVLSSDRSIEPVADAIYGSLKNVLDNELKGPYRGNVHMNVVLKPIMNLVQEASKRAVERLLKEHDGEDKDVEVRQIEDPRPKMKSHPAPTTSMPILKDKEEFKNWYPLEEGDEG